MYQDITVKLVPQKPLWGKRLIMFPLWNMRLLFFFFLLLKGIWNLTFITHSNFPYLCFCFPVSLLRIFIKWAPSTLFARVAQTIWSTSWPCIFIKLALIELLASPVLCSHGRGSLCKNRRHVPLFKKFFLLSLKSLIWKLFFQVWSSASSLRNSRAHHIMRGDYKLSQNVPNNFPLHLEIPILSIPSAMKVIFSTT